MIPSTTPLLLSSPLFLFQAASGASPAVTVGTALAVSAVVLGASHYAYLRLLKNSPERPPLSMPRGTLPLVLANSVAMHALLWKHAELGAAAERAYRKGRILWNEVTAPSTPKDPSLAAEARKALIRWKQDGSLGDLEGFISRVATRLHRPSFSPADAADFLSKWKDYLAERKSLIDSTGPLETIEDARSRFGEFQRMIVDDFPGYLRGQWDLTVTFGKKRANCVGRMNLMFSVFGDITLPPHLVLAVEVFGESPTQDVGHVQPLLYDLKTGQYWNLWDGTVHSKSRGDIYYAALVYHAFLMKQMAIPPISSQELLIAGMADPYERPREEKKEKKVSNSPFGFPSSDAYYPGGAGGPHDIPTEDVFSKEEIKTFRQTLAEKSLEYDLLVKDESSLLLFKDDAKRDHYRSLPSWRAKRDYLLSLFEESVKMFEERQEFRDLLRLLEDPYGRLPGASRADLQQAMKTFERYNELSGTPGRALNYLLSKFQRKLANVREEIGEWVALNDDAHQRQPGFRRLSILLEAIQTSIDKDQAPLFLMLNEIEGLEEKRLAIELSTQSQKSEILSQFLGDKSKIGTGSKKTAPYNPPSIAPYAFEIIWQTPEWEIPDENASPVEPAVPVSEPSSRIEVSPETMIDSILLLRSSPERWTLDLARAYPALANEERDRLFLKDVELYFWSNFASEGDRERLTTQELISSIAGKAPKPIAMTFEDVLKRRGMSFFESARESD